MGIKSRAELNKVTFQKLLIKIKPVLYSNWTRAINVSSKWRRNGTHPAVGLTLYICFQKDFFFFKGQEVKWNLTYQNKPQAVFISFLLNVKKHGGCVKIFKIKKQTHSECLL